MKRPRSTKYKLILASTVIAAGALAESGFAATGYVPYTTAGSSYSPNFGALATQTPGAATITTLSGATGVSSEVSLTSAGLTSDTTDAGFGDWYTQESGGSGTSMKIGIGEPSTTTGAVFSFESSSSNQALGAISTSTSGQEFFGVELVNQTGTTLTSLNIQATDALWWQGTQKNLDFGYQVVSAATATSSSLPDSAASLTQDTNLMSDFTGGTVSSGAVSAPVGTESLSDTIPISLTPGEGVWLDWYTDTDASKSQGIGLSALNVTLSVPEPASLSLLSLGGLAMLGRRRGKKA